MSSSQTRNSRTTSPGSARSSSEEADVSKSAKDTKIQWKKTKSTKVSSSPAQSPLPRRSTKNSTGRGYNQREATQRKRSTRENDEERNHQGRMIGRDTALAKGTRGKESTPTTVDQVIRRKNVEPKFEPRFTLYKKNSMLDGVHLQNITMH